MDHRSVRQTQCWCPPQKESVLLDYMKHFLTFKTKLCLDAVAHCGAQVLAYSCLSASWEDQFNCSYPVKFDSICIVSIWRHNIMKPCAICVLGHTIIFDLNPALNTSSLLACFRKGLQNTANTSFRHEALLNTSFTGVALACIILTSREINLNGFEVVVSTWL